MTVIEAAKPAPEQAGFSNERPGKKICIFTETYFPEIGGGERQAQSLAEALSGRGFQVFVLTGRSQPSLKIIDQVDGIRVYRLPPSSNSFARKWGLLLTSLPALLLLKKQYDLIFVSGFRILGLPSVIASKLLGKTCVLKADSLGELSGEYFTNGLLKHGLNSSPIVFRQFLSFRNRVLKSADAFVAISSVVAREYAQAGITPDLIHLIPNSVDTARFIPINSDQKLRLRKKIGLPLRDILVMYTGRLVTYKGLPLLLRVWHQIRSQYDQVTMVLVGEGGLDIHNCEEELRSYAGKNGLHESIYFTGRVQNVHEYLQAADIFVFPTENEAFGVSLIEAMACGLPAISTNVGGLSDILQHFVNGLVVPPGDFQSLYDALELLITQPSLAARLGQAALQTVHASYSQDLVFNTYVCLFTQTMNLNAIGDRASC